MVNRRTLVPLCAALSLCVLSASVWSQPPGLGRIHPAPAKKPAAGEQRPQLNSPGGSTTYHNGATLICSDCHIMHASAQHDFAGGVGEGLPYSGPPHDKLLKAADSLDLCLACHDGKAGVPDVVGADANGLAERSAGFFDEPEASNWKGHNLGRGLESGDSLCYRCHFGGEFATAKVTCTDCHNPHGNGNVRNLQWASWPGGEPPFGLFERPGVTGTARYERDNVSYGTLDSDTLREISNMCKDCHHTFSGGYYIDPDGDGIHSRHPAYDSEASSTNNIRQGETRGSTDPAHWIGGLGSGFEGAARVPFVVSGASDFTAATNVDADSNGAFCLSCHKAHGGAHAFGLTWQAAGGAGPRGCDQCHAVSGP